MSPDELLMSAMGIVAAHARSLGCEPDSIKLPPSPNHNTPMYGGFSGWPKPKPFRAHAIPPASEAMSGYDAFHKASEPHIPPIKPIQPIQPIVVPPAAQNPFVIPVFSEQEMYEEALRVEEEERERQEVAFTRLSMAYQALSIAALNLKASNQKIKELNLKLQAEREKNSKKEDQS